MVQHRMSRDDAVQQARAAITALAVASCDCPFETERELAEEIRRLRADLDYVNQTLAATALSLSKARGALERIHRGDPLPHKIAAEALTNG